MQVQVNHDACNYVISAVRTMEVQYCIFNLMWCMVRNK